MKTLIKEIGKLFLGLFVLYISYNISRGFNEYHQNMLWWIICGLPYGLPRTRTWIYITNADIAVTLMIFTLNFMLAGAIGGIVFGWIMLRRVFNILAILFNMIKNKVTACV